VYRRLLLGVSGRAACPGKPQNQGTLDPINNQGHVWGILGGATESGGGFNRKGRQSEPATLVLPGGWLQVTALGPPEVAHTPQNAGVLWYATGPWEGGDGGR
jgi:hypothetical protein